MGSRIVHGRRMLFAAFAALALVTAAPISVLAEDDTFDVTGTVHSKNAEKETIVFITDDLGTRNQPITIDMSKMSGQFEAIREGQSASFQVRRRESDSYLAYTLVSEGSYVQRNDFGTREEFETRGSSVQAHVGNVPEDDESLSQQHRTNDLRRQDEDDHDNNPND